MKKLILIIALLFVASFGASAQGRDFKYADGITLNAYPGLGATQAGDSLHEVGTFTLRNTNMTPWDSLGFGFSWQDSLRYQFVVKANYGLTSTDTATCFIGTNVAKYYAQATAAGVDWLPWHVIMSALSGKAQYAKSVTLYVRVWRVGSEVASSLKKMNILPKGFD